MTDRRDVQRARRRCECGGTQQVAQTLSIWEFVATCDQCHAIETISWAHANPAPEYIPDDSGAQGELF